MADQSIVEQVVEMAIHPPQSSYGFRKPACLLWVIFVESKHTNTMSGDEWAQILVCFICICLETDVAVGSRFQHLIKRVVDNRSYLFILLYHERGGAVRNYSWPKFFEKAISCELANDTTGAVHI